MEPNKHGILFYKQAAPMVLLSISGILRNEYPVYSQINSNISTPIGVSYGYSGLKAISLAYFLDSWFLNLGSRY
jgi:hypothetical protein